MLPVCVGEAFSQTRQSCPVEDVSSSRRAAAAPVLAAAASLSPGFDVM